MNNKVLVLSDNINQIERFKELVDKKNLKKYSFEYAYSNNNKAMKSKYGNDSWICAMDVKQSAVEIIQNYDLVISMHCKQIFPDKMVNGVRCINVHPGLNPHNRGWFPQVFSIINGLPCGATLHEIDEDLDHGPIIAQKEVKLGIDDTSYSAYNRILEVEIELLNENIEKILTNNYDTFSPKEGNLNLKKDFNELCKLDLTDTDTLENHINRLRALTHGEYKNAYFFDEDGNKIFISVELAKDQ